MNRKEPFILPDKWYDIIKWVAYVFLPYFTIFLGAVFTTLNVGWGAAVTSIMVAFYKMLQGILEASKKNYYNAYPEVTNVTVDYSEEMTDFEEAYKEDDNE